MKKNLIIFPKGTLSATDKRALQRDGFLPIEADDPSKIVLPDFTPNVQTKDLLLAFAKGLDNGHSPKTAAMDEILRRLRINIGCPTP